MNTGHLIETRSLLETARPRIIDAIRRNQGQPMQARLIALRNELDSVIDDLYRKQMDQKEAA